MTIVDDRYGLSVSISLTTYTIKSRLIVYTIEVVSYLTMVFINPAFIVF